ncbi:MULTISPECIES: sulfite oxidase [unclassified Ensifer]|uniref:sulfite oxidase n=1 Tax=unclassified Ensifer TaxID=2633371 RepID=UPI000812E5EE|nr:MULTISPECIES: sulfite oxidase [unclassified Ensifer]OCP00774.1 oxidoreductase [Ensifer sp. LC13]OCP00810.1 oxidoreductase [Ensifer sp. LC11]OCP03699.1 oxidoreductase [Ensifer sp. LC14]OCP29715.1 oxidoreductase [Ensifer sp. LC499]
MPLFIVHHQHSPETCPARDPAKGAMLLNHLSRPSAARHGVVIKGEAVVRGLHSLFFIAEAADETVLQAFLAPFRQAGEVEVIAAMSCAAVVSSGGCDACPVDVSAALLDPADACQDAIEAGLLIHRVNPLNGETSVPDLAGGAVMPNGRFYLRNHFEIPSLDGDSYRLSVGGLVERSLSLSLRELHNLHAESFVVTLECAGNGRNLFDPAVPGEAWGLGAVSTAEWTGIPLIEVLERAGLRPGATELVFRGADSGLVEGHDAPVRFERGLSLDQIRETDALLAYEMNGEPLSSPHGYPLRLIVPGWYAVASVKWLTEIVVTDEPCKAHYQTEKYWYQWPRNGREERAPVKLMNVRALISSPDQGESLPRGETAIRGVAWSGAGSISRVDVSLNGGPWRAARLVGEGRRAAWQWWELITPLEETGPLTVRARATDMAGRTQPECAEWNRLGYGNNSIHAVTAQVI